MHRNIARLPRRMPIPTNGGIPVAHVFADIFSAKDSTVTDNTFVCDSSFADPNTGQTPPGAQPAIRIWACPATINLTVANNLFAGTYASICRIITDQPVTGPC